MRESLNPSPLHYPPCARIGCGELESLDKSCSKCLVVCYCSVDCYREDWPEEAVQAEQEGRAQGSDRGGESARGAKQQLRKPSRDMYVRPRDITFERRKGVTNITVGVLMVLRAYKDRKKLEALAKLSGREEGFGDHTLHLEAMRSLVPLLEQAHAVGEGVTEEEVLDRVFALGEACMWMHERDGYLYCFERAKEGFVRLLGKGHAKSVEATFSFLFQTTMGDKRIAEMRTPWERVKVALPDEVVTYDVANDLGGQLRKKGQVEEAKVLYLAALEGRRRVHEVKHKKNLSTYCNPFYHKSVQADVRRGKKYT